VVKKERNRYILFKVITKDNTNLAQREVLDAVWQSIWKLFGLREASKVGLWLLDIDFKEGFGVIRCSHNTKEIVISAITLITEISGKKVILSPIKTSGTIRSIKTLKKLITNKG
jgi:ribonuclease P/MRP protein subunit POP5